jgi:hypothetical protein
MRSTCSGSADRPEMGPHEMRTHLAPSSQGERLVPTPSSSPAALDVPPSALGQTVRRCLRLSCGPHVPLQPLLDRSSREQVRAPSADVPDIASSGKRFEPVRGQLEVLGGLICSVDVVELHGPHNGRSPWWSQVRRAGSARTVRPRSPLSSATRRASRLPSAHSWPQLSLTSTRSRGRDCCRTPRHP